MQLPHMPAPGDARAHWLQFNPSTGLADQKDRSGINCFRCPKGSIALKDPLTSADATDATMPEGSTFCDAW